MSISNFARNPTLNYASPAEIMRHGYGKERFSLLIVYGEI